jgi:hypothetical protein
VGLEALSGLFLITKLHIETEASVCIMYVETWRIIYLLLFDERQNFYEFRLYVVFNFCERQNFYNFFKITTKNVYFELRHKKYLKTCRFDD